MGSMRGSEGRRRDVISRSNGRLGKSQGGNEEDEKPGSVPGGRTESADSADVDALVDALDAERGRELGRPLRVVPYAFSDEIRHEGIDAVWIALDGTDWILYRADASDAERSELISREVDRMLAGFEPIETSAGLDAVVAVLEAAGFPAPLVRHMFG
jgi:hypothetical protein